MKNKFTSLTTVATLAAALVFSGNAVAQTKTTATPKAASTPANPPPSDKDIADAQAKGLVWVNTTTKVYHKEGSFYGKTKRGKFMTEADAQKAGYKAAKEPAARKSATATTKK